jgi:hypothetical protein
VETQGEEIKRVSKETMDRWNKAGICVEWKEVSVAAKTLKEL